MAVEAIGSLEQLESLLPEWESLWERVAPATPFQHPGWLLPWWKTFGGGTLFTFTVRENGRLTAIAPLFLHNWQGRRQVTFLGNGVSDYLDILCEEAEAAHAAVLTALAECREHWDLCDWQDIAWNSPLRACLPSVPLQSAVQPQNMCSTVSLPSEADRFLQDLPHGLRRNLRRYRSQLQAVGEVRFETADDSSYLESVDALFTLHNARWQEKDDPGMLSTPGLQCFHRTALANLWERGMVRLHSLRLDGRIVAVVYALVHRHRAYSYLGGFDPALARFSPGALIMGYTIEQTIAEGVTEFDFLRGRESYKSNWGAQPRMNSRLFIWHGQPPSDLLEAESG